MTPAQQLFEAWQDPMGWGWAKVRPTDFPAPDHLGQSLGISHPNGARLTLRAQQKDEMSWLKIDVLHPTPGLYLDPTSRRVEQSHSMQHFVCRFFLDIPDLNIHKIQALWRQAFSPPDPTFWRLVLVGSILHVHRLATGLYVVERDGSVFGDDLDSPYLGEDPIRLQACKALGLGLGRMQQQLDGRLHGDFPAQMHVSLPMPTSAHGRLQALHAYHQLCDS